MSNTKETAIQFVLDVLKRNGFKDTPGGYKNDKCMIFIREDHYQVRHYEEAFLDWMDWFSTDLTIFSLMGYLSWNDFIERGYEK